MRQFNFINKYKILTAKEELDLAKKSLNGCRKSRDKLILSNMRFVLKIARKYKNRGLDIDDLFQEGCKGLIKSIDKFEPKKGFRLLTYAIWWINQAILLAIAEQSSIIRTPVHAFNKKKNLERFRDKLFKKLKRLPTKKELETYSKIPIKYLNNQNATISLDEIKDYDDSHPLLESIKIKEETPDKQILNKDLREFLDTAVAELSEREIEIIQLYHGLNNTSERFTLEEIAEFFNVTRERIRQIKERSLAVIMYKHGEKLKDYLSD